MQRRYCPQNRESQREVRDLRDSDRGKPVRVDYRLEWVPKKWKLMSLDARFDKDIERRLVRVKGVKMKRVGINAYIVLFVLGLQLSFSEAQGAPKTYQVTGPVLELTDKMIVVQKGDERWEIARDESTKVKGNLKVGQKVTIQYRMTATAVEVKENTSEANQNRR